MGTSNIHPYVFHLNLENGLWEETEPEQTSKEIADEFTAYEALQPGSVARGEGVQLSRHKMHPITVSQSKPKASTVEAASDQAQRRALASRSRACVPVPANGAFAETTSH
jgi:hypothetical protein